MNEGIKTVKLIRDNINRAIIGKEAVVDLLLAAVICSGHVLLEDVPGLGKTSLAKSLAKSINCDFRRIQFTPDLLPADLTGTNFYNQKTGDFLFRKGPVFTNILLADEINRATPRTQSSLLECMEERQVTVDNETYILDAPFLVLATQNPVESHGTFPLPEAQMDRFLMRLGMGYPDRQEEHRILKLQDENSAPGNLQPVCDRSDILAMQAEYGQVYITEDQEEYILEITDTTRNHQDVELGVSPRGSIALRKSAKAYAYLQGRDFVKPDDIMYLAPYILSHRLLLKRGGRLKRNDPRRLMEEILAGIKPPLEKTVTGKSRKE